MKLPCGCINRGFLPVQDVEVGHGKASSASSVGRKSLTFLPEPVESLTQPKSQKQLFVVESTKPKTLGQKHDRNVPPCCSFSKAQQNGIKPSLKKTEILNQKKLLNSATRIAAEASAMEALRFLTPKQIPIHREGGRSR